MRKYARYKKLEISSPKTQGWHGFGIYWNRGLNAKKKIGENPHDCPRLCKKL